MAYIFLRCIFPCCVWRRASHFALFIFPFVKTKKVFAIFSQEHPPFRLSVYTKSRHVVFHISLYYSYYESQNEMDSISPERQGGTSPVYILTRDAQNVIVLESTRRKAVWTKKNCHRLSGRTRSTYEGGERESKVRDKLRIKMTT